jgi:tRNA threonylcarbamoyl adenosine modification protein (Sua5/YciO/YrdC/YwlC family)
MMSMKRLLNKMNPKIIKTNEKGAIEIASQLIKEGQVIALPTDTIYGLACNANDPEAIKKLYNIKGRNFEKPVAICVSDYDDFFHYGNGQHLPRKLVTTLLPGPFTIVLNKTEHLSNPYINPGVKKIGIRIPDFDFIRNVCKNFKNPIALTSANRSAEKSSLNIKEFEKLWKDLGAIFDGGQLSDTEEARVGSTVIDLSEKDSCIIIRRGMNFQTTEKLLNEYNIKIE